MGDKLDGQGSIPGKGKIFLISIVSRLAVEPAQPLIQWVSGKKWQVHEADHSAGVKNGGAIPSLPYTTSWHGSQLSTGTTLLCCIKAFIG
jgi:hypothetical protein